MDQFSEIDGIIRFNGNCCAAMENNYKSVMLLLKRTELTAAGGNSCRFDVSSSSPSFLYGGRGCFVLRVIVCFF